MKCEKCIFDINSDLVREYKKNDFIFFEGDIVEHVYLIKSGIVKLEKIHESGEVRIIDIVKEGDYLALLTVLKEMEDYVVTATCLTDVVISPIKKQDANKAYEENLQFKETCLKCAAHRLGVFQGHTFMSVNTSPEEKIIIILKHLSKKFGYKENGFLYVDIPITKTDLANMIGLRRETLSRKLSSMQKSGVLEIQKNIYKIASV